MNQRRAKRMRRAAEASTAGFPAIRYHYPHAHAQRRLHIDSTRGTYVKFKKLLGVNRALTTCELRKALEESA